MKPMALIPALAVTLCAFSTAASAMSTAPYVGSYPGASAPGSLTGSEPNRLSPTMPNGINDDAFINGRSVYPNPYLSLGPNDLQAPRIRQRSGPGFLNVDPFDPNSTVNSYDRNLYANPFPYDPIYNPFGQGGSQYSPGGGPTVPMGNGIRYGR